MHAGRIDVLDRICYVYRHRYNGAITKTVSPRHFEVFDQYERLFAMVDDAAGALDEFRPELFRFMINHYLVILGNRRRLPEGMQREFFHRIAEEYRRWRPGKGYPVPEGSAGVKHRLVRHDAYAAYATLRVMQRVAAPLRRGRSVVPSALSVDPTAAIESVTLPRQRTSGELEPSTELEEPNTLPSEV
jgi:CDP-glycerol glycerophosphotransferase